MRPIVKWALILGVGAIIVLSLGLGLGLGLPDEATLETNQARTKYGIVEGFQYESDEIVGLRVTKADPAIT